MMTFTIHFDDSNGTTSETLIEAKSNKMALEQATAKVKALRNSYKLRPSDVVTLVTSDGVELNRWFRGNWW